MSNDKNIGHDFTLRYDGRVLRLDIFVNTDEDPNEVLMRVQKAARGQQRNAVVAAASIYSGKQGQEVWAGVQGLVKQVAQNPKSENVDEDGKPL